MENKFKTGDILLCEGRGLIAKGISLFTKSRTTHTANAINFDGMIYILDAQRKGVQMLPFERWQKIYNYKFTTYEKLFIADREVWEKKFILKAFNQLGKKYDYELLLREFPISILKKNDVKDKFRANGKFICSELTAWLHGWKNPEDFSPKMVEEALKYNLDYANK